MATTRRPGGTPKNPRRAASSRTGGSAPGRPLQPRPAAGARGSRPSQDRRTPPSVKRLAILASIFVMLAITLIPALRATLSQRGEINGLRDRIVEQREKVATLQQEQQRWGDPAYVEQQARERLKFVRVGEKSFTVIDGEAPIEVIAGANIATPGNSSSAKNPWYGELWRSMLIADIPERPVPGAPASAPAVP